MVPRRAMLATKNRAGREVIALLITALFLVACGPPGPRALLRGKSLLESGKTAEAIEQFRTATTLMPTNAAAWNYLGVAFHRAGQWTNAAESYSRALRFDRDLLEVRFNLGTLWLDMNRLDEAKNELFSYTSRRPDEAIAWVKLGTAQLRGGELVAAEKSFREALRVENKNVAALNGIGLVQAQRNRPREAVESFTAALAIQTNFPPALLNLATIQQQLNNRTEALKWYRHYLALQPRPADWDAVRAIVETLEPAAAPPVASSSPVAPTNAVRQTSVSQPVRAPVVRSAPVTASNTTVQASVRNVTNAAPPARAVEKTVSSLQPEPKPVANASTPPPGETVKLSPDSAIKPIASETVTSRLDSSSTNRVVNRSEPVKPSSPPPVSSQTVTKNESDRYAYRSPQVPPPGDRASAQQALLQGQNEHRARRTAEALQFYRRATQLDGSYFEAYYLLGTAAYELRSFSTAAAAWEMALAIRPESSDARYNFALTLKAAGYLRDAVAELEKLLALHPDEARAHLILGNLYGEKLKDVPRARQHYQRVLQLDPRNPEAQNIRYWLVQNPG